MVTPSVSPAGSPGAPLPAASKLTGSFSVAGRKVSVIVEDTTAAKHPVKADEAFREAVSMISSQCIAGGSTAEKLCISISDGNLPGELRFNVHFATDRAGVDVTVEKMQDLDEVRFDEVVQKKMLLLVEQAYIKYNPCAQQTKSELTTMFGSYGDIQVRAKNPVSGANRLLRALKAPWGPKDGVRSVDDVVKNLWDSVGARIVVTQDTAGTVVDKMEKVTQALIQGIRAGTLKVKELNNLRGVDGMPYFSSEQILRIRTAAAMAGAPIPKISDRERTKGSPFTAVCCYLDLGQGVTGELQIIGKTALRLADAEHIPYDAMIAKDPYREVTVEGRRQMDAAGVADYTRCVGALTGDQKEAYTGYLTYCYALARSEENGYIGEVQWSSVPVPTKLASFSALLSIENVIRLEEECEAIKKRERRPI
jgi:hypothetical protein